MRAYRAYRANRETRVNQELWARQDFQVPKETEDSMGPVDFQGRLDRKEIQEGMESRVCLVGLVYQVIQGCQDLSVYLGWKGCQELQVFRVKMDSLVDQE